MPADEFGASLRGVGVNLLVVDISRSVRFAEQVFQSGVTYADEDFAVLALSGAMVLLHADHAYSNHPLSAAVDGAEVRGMGAEIRLYECDPDEAERRAREHDYVVLAGAMDKPHGLRETYLLDPDGYCWVASKPLIDSTRQT
ncbi:MAG: VOC family protein [Gammaproteobacteria bacterium]|nr:VOC family protein [Gammaproteobacteria bacterium]